MVLWGATTNGPLALPGTYQVRLTVDGKSQTQPLVVKKHPLRTTPDADLQQQFDLALQIRDKVSEANNAVIQIRKIKDEVKDRLTKSQDAQLKAAGERLTKSLSAVEEDIYQVRNQSGQDPLNFPIKTNNRLASLLGMTLRGEGKPTANIYPIFEDLKKELKAETDRLEEVLTADWPRSTPRRSGRASIRSAVSELPLIPQREGQLDVDLDFHRFVVHGPRLEFPLLRRGHGLLVQLVVQRLGDLDVADRAVFQDDRRNADGPLHPPAHGALGVLRLDLLISTGAVTPGPTL